MGGGGRSLNEAIIGAHNPYDEKRISGPPIVTQVLAFLVKSVQVWQLQSEKRQISQPKHTQEVQPWHVGERVQPLYTLRLARSSSSLHVILKYINNHSHHHY